ncbi:MAG: hypothetical protein A2Z81_10025 [Omnitrophica WOR_2 bacterium GWA2_45_18]|nr:MAG: hypothetical protein A2Z81_10025 [Omnitrophica WOR_2 bacterium GWA2_45_18]
MGFRFTVQRYAFSLDLKGWVKNLPDGRVEIFVEGPKEKVERLMAQVEDDFGEYIQNKELTSPSSDPEEPWRPEKFKDFKIVHY